MRKLFGLLLVVLMALAPLSLAACEKKEAANEYSITAEYFPEEGKLVATQETKVFNRSENVLKELKFQLWANAFREGAVYRPVSDVFASSAYYDGKSYGNITITSVAGGSYAVGGEDENVLCVSLDEELYPDECATVTISYEVRLAKIEHRLGITRNAVNLTGFYPVLCHLEQNGFCEHVYSSNGDPFVGDNANFFVTLTLPGEYRVISNGSVEEGAKSQNRTYHIVAENVRDFALVLGKDFKIASAEACGVPVKYYYLSDKSPESTLKVACQSLEYYSKTFVPYDYPAYTLVQTDFVFGGMEFCGLAMVANSLHESEIPAVVAHETAHQWWYGMIGSDQYNEAWQDEGLAEYSAALFFENHPDYGVSYADCIQTSERSYRAFFSIMSQLGGADTRMSRPLTEYRGDYEYRNIAYDKGVILFDRVRQTVGDKAFFASFEAYAKRYKGKLASREELIACFDEKSGAGEMFFSFLDGKCVI